MLHTGEGKIPESSANPQQRPSVVLSHETCMIKSGVLLMFFWGKKGLMNLH